MKSILTLLVGLSFVAGAIGAQAAAPAPTERAVPISQVFMPEVVEFGQEVFAVANGILPNGCYVYQRSEVKATPGENFFEITNYALVHPGMCIMVLVPFNQQIKFGKLAKGKYNFRFVNGDGTYVQKHVVVQ